MVYEAALKILFYNHMKLSYADCFNGIPYCQYSIRKQCNYNF